MAVTLDQVATLETIGGTSTPISWSVNPTAGSKVIVAFVPGNAITPTSVIDNGTSPTTFTLDSGPGGGTNHLYIYRADNITLPSSGSYTVTVTWPSASGGASGSGASYLGVAAGGPTSSNAGNTASTSVSTGNTTPAGAGALFFAAFTDVSGLNPETISLTGSGFSSIAIQTNGASFACEGVAYKIDSGGPTATACTWTLGDSVNWSAAIVAYDAAAAPPPASFAMPGKTWRRRFRHQQTPSISPSSSVSTSVTGLAAAITVASPVGTVAVGVTGLVGQLTVASPLGTVQTGISGLTGQITVAAPLGTVTGSAVLTGVVAQVAVASPVGTVAVGIPGVTGQITVTAPVGSVGTAVIGLVGQITVASPVGTVATAVSGVTAQVTVASPVGTVTTSGNVSITGLVAQVNVASPVGIVSAAVQGLTGQITVAAPVGAVATGVTGLTGQITVASPVGTVRTGVSGLTGQITVASPVGTVGTGVIGLTGQISVAAPVGSLAVSLTGQLAQISVASPLGNVTVSNAPGAAYAYPGMTWRKHFRHRQQSATGPPQTVINVPICFSGTETDANLLAGGEVDANTLGGTAVDANGFGATDVETNTFGGSQTETNTFGGSSLETNEFGGTPGGLGLGGSLIGGCMQAANITLGEFNDEVLDLTITQNSVAFNLTGYSLTMYLKTAAGTPDGSAVWTGTSTGGSPAIVITSPSGGLAVVTIPHASLNTTAIGFWRLDAINGSGLQNTVLYGTVTMTPL